MNSSTALNDHHCIQISNNATINKINSTSNGKTEDVTSERDISLKQPRLVSLDVFRGLTVALMVLVDHVGGILPGINHSPWNGISLADFVMPFFLFIVGVALSFAYKRFKCRVDLTKKATLRTLKLFIFGIVLQGGYFHGINNLTYGVDIQQIRLMGTLQRIAIAYLLTAVCEIWLKRDGVVKSGRSMLKKYKLQWIYVVVLTVTYTALLYGLHVADWEYQIPSENFSFSSNITSVNCGVRGDTGPACNAVGMIDRNLFGIQHLHKRPTYARTKECSMNSPVLHFKDHKDRILSWTMSAAGLVVVGFVSDLCGMHINKSLYSLSYTCVTGGAAGILFVGIYVMVDVLGFRKPTLVFEWMGKHALVIYILAACNVFPILLQGFYWKEPENNFLRLIGIGQS
ncbi:hypothetical protein C5167_043700 [Papaver somniferum]|uniref:Heparan-alpha-glucosaminide N-acetyltransferase catalytic domain-containing protein n=1 Tax=Papaver somniferum TaxID=3469 RepID=A0A4Y7L6F6_PAPSO|nr:hypothetical protein C5167_043700 [Papaver somniferum]